MIPELGHFALILALILAVILATFPMIGSLVNIPGWVALGRPAAFGQFFFIAIAFGCLVNAFLTNDFSVAYVARYVAHMFWWLQGKGDELGLIGGQAWPWRSANQVRPSTKRPGRTEQEPGEVPEEVLARIGELNRERVD